MPRYHSPGFDPVDTVVVQNSTSYSMSPVDTIVEANLTTPSAISIVGPNNQSPIGKIFTIKDGAGNAAAFNITFTPSSGTGTIDGASSKIINTNYGSFSFYFDGTNLQTINSGTSGSGASSINLQTGTSYTAALSDSQNSTLVIMSNASANTFTVPANATVAFPVGSEMYVEQGGAGATTIAAAGGVTINKVSTLTATGQYAVIGLIQTSANVWTAFGALA